MDALSGDVVLVILRKLAAEDPLSLLRATCVLAPFHRVAAENREIWKVAFMGSHHELVMKKDVQIWPCWQAELADLDAEVETVGGYKILLSSLLIEPQRSRNIVEQRQKAWDTVQGQNFRSKKVMILVRLHGRAVLWGSYPQDALETPSEGHIGNGFVGVSLHSLYPVDFPKALKNNRVLKKGINTWADSVTERVAGLSLEVYGFFTLTKGLGPASGEQSWCGKHLPSAVRVPVSRDDTVPELHALGHILQQHDQNTGVTGVSAVLIIESQHFPEWMFMWREKDWKLERRNELTQYWAGLETLMRAS